MDVSNHKSEQLTYTIHNFSSYAVNYVPENIMVNKPSDQLSRWFTDSTTPSQFIMLKLERPAVVHTIKFGKYLKSHVSDLKKFQVFGGTDDTNVSLILSAGLKKDSAAEVFRLRHRTVEGLYLPIQYIKIVPIQSWGPAYNYTIWYVELHGIQDAELISDALDTISLRKEEEAVRLILKHLQRRRYTAAFNALAQESGVRLQGAVQARLYKELVDEGNYKAAEEVMEQAKHEGELEWFVSWQQYSPEWRQMSGGCSQEDTESCPVLLQTPSANVDINVEVKVEDGPTQLEPMDISDSSSLICDTPGPRGGHQLVCDSTTGTLYLFGGWNGTEDLDDLWCFNPATEKWTLLCQHSKQVNGPSPRSCHKMVFDTVNRRLYILGRYIDGKARKPDRMNSDLYMYDVTSNEWSLVCDDTSQHGGPRLVFDHQMCIDADTQTFYVFGGRVMSTVPSGGYDDNPSYSGLYAYYIRTNTWQQLLPDKHNLRAPQPRVSHSMLFHPVERRLYIFAGQRNKEHLQDLWWWDVNSNACGALCTGTTRQPPAAGFTQRATIDPDANEIYVLSGMSKEKDKTVYNTLWVFCLRRQMWSCIYRNDKVSPYEPRPRFAHQLVYNPVTKIHYLFGGNPGNQASTRQRLDDLWMLTLDKPTPEHVYRQCRALLREACFKEMCAKGEEMKAVEYLRNEVKESLDQSDPEQMKRFHKLAVALFAGTEVPTKRPPYALSGQRMRALNRRRANNVQTNADLALHVAAVLGSEEQLPDPIRPYEDATDAPDTWDIGEDIDYEQDADANIRVTRMALYDTLSKYFKPSSVPPLNDVSDLVRL